MVSHYFACWILNNFNMKNGHLTASTAGGTAIVRVRLLRFNVVNSFLNVPLFPSRAERLFSR